MAKSPPCQPAAQFQPVGEATLVGPFRVTQWPSTKNLMASVVHVRRKKNRHRARFYVELAGLICNRTDEYLGIVQVAPESAQIIGIRSRLCDAAAVL